VGGRIERIGRTVFCDIVASRGKSTRLPDFNWAGVRGRLEFTVAEYFDDLSGIVNVKP
jgi:hypothetical protein